MGEVRFDAISAEEFGEVEGAVGGIEEGEWGLPGLRDGDGDANADGLEVPGATGVRKAYGFGGGAEGFGGGHGAGAVGIGENDGELFATEARGFAEVGGDAVGDDVGDLAEAIVAVDVAVEVVVLLEQVDVDHKEGEGLAGDEGAIPFFLKALVEGAAVGKAGKTVE